MALDTAIPQVVFAAVGKTRITSLHLEGSDSNEAEGWSWDADAKTQTLNNATVITDDVYGIPNGGIEWDKGEAIWNRML